PREPIYQEGFFTLVEELAIGYEGGKEERAFADINDIAVDASENIYVLDIRQGKIRVFDKNGQYLRDIGQRGQGPAEFQFPNQILVTPGQEFAIVDLIASRLLFFSLAGAFKRSVPTWKHGRPIRALVDPEGNIVCEILLGGEKKGFALMKFDSDFEEPLTITFKERGKVPLLEDLSPRIVWSVTQQGQIIWGDSGEYEVKILDRTGKLINKITKESDPEKIVAAEYQEQIKKKFGGKPIPPDFEQELPKYYPAFRSLELDDQGRLFVSTYEKVKGGKGYFIDVFDPESKYIAKIPLAAQPRIYMNRIYKKGKLYAVEEDEEGYPVVKRYRLEWKAN
ncbi:MAG: 6-bladed beta-propeller, partial [Candidatus Aminicenantes bacterium]|nr:6-bladed beta-propeller [Candidatus Aminicenantes bacterium]